MDESMIVERARSTLVELLSNGAEPGARLKLRLQRALRERGVAFDERRLGYPKFAAFLRAQGDLVELSDVSRGGDLSVSLRTDRAPNSQAPKRHGRLRKAVWQAFTNPDPGRHRYFNVESGRVVHYAMNMLAPQDREIEARVRQEASRHIEIKPVPGQDQKTWMVDFLEDVELQPEQRSALQRLLEAPYSGHMNGVFVDALGRLATPYQVYRANRVVSHVEVWAQQHEIDMDRLIETTRKDVDPGTSPRGVSQSPQTPQRARVEHLLRAVLAELTEDELRSVLLPAAIVLAGRR